MINLLFFNPLNHFPIVHLVRTNHCPAVTYVAFTASTLQGKKGMTQQLAEMTSKCFLPQAFANYQPPVLGGDPSSARVNRVTPTAGYNKDQTSVQPVWRPSMKPCYDDGINGTGLRGRTGLWDSGRKPLLTALTCLQEPPGRTDTRTSDRCLGKLPHSSWHFCGISLNCFFISSRTRRGRSHKSLIKQILELHTDMDRCTL